MSDDITTTLNAALTRMVDQTVDVIATDGLRALKGVLDSSGFPQSEHLKDYQIFAHVARKQIEFEIQLDVDSVVPADESTREAMEVEIPEEMEDARTYGWGAEGPQRIVGRPARDVRKPARDARRPLRDAGKQNKDARKDAKVRFIEHEIALVNPRRAELDMTKRLKVAIRRTMRETEDKVEMPKGEFEGIIKKIMDELQKVIIDSFVPKLKEIIERYVAV